MLVAGCDFSKDVMASSAWDIVKQRLRSPSTATMVGYHSYSYKKYKARTYVIEYDAQNGFGAMLRGEAYVFTYIDKKTGNEIIDDDVVIGLKGENSSDIFDMSVIMKHTSFSDDLIEVGGQKREDKSSDQNVPTEESHETTQSAVNKTSDAAATVEPLHNAQNQVQGIVSRYYELQNSGDQDSVFEMYADRLDRFYLETNLTKSDVIASTKKYYEEHHDHFSLDGPCLSQSKGGKMSCLASGEVCTDGKPCNRVKVEFIFNSDLKIESVRAFKAKS